MPSLLTLPLELRLDIIDLVIRSSTNTPPIDETDLAPRKRFRDINHRSTWGDMWSKYLTDPSKYIFNASGILCANRQLRRETLNRVYPLSNGGKPRIDYALDVLVVRSEELWVTWTCLPMPAVHVDTLSVTFRIFGLSRYSPGGWRHGSDAFYGLLERFFLLGPAPDLKAVWSNNGEGMPTKFKLMNSKVTIGLLNLEVPGGQGDELPRARTADEEKLRWVMRSDELIQELHLALFNAISFPSLAEIIFEGIGRIRLTIDGEVKKEYDLDGWIVACIGELETGKWEEDKKQWFIREWNRLAAFRERAGLSVHRPTGTPGAPKKRAECKKFMQKFSRKVDFGT